MELKHHQEAQADRQRRRDAGEDVPDVQESSITTYGRWQARDSEGLVLQWSSEDEEPDISSCRHPRPPSNDDLSDV